mmetsp:Transcript_11199/g.26927  ORF Transcript_11199/g.26927 Transcript_11199/m.26927 type:complete len:741 (+) Transcript_11199:151-2373(+)
MKALLSKKSEEFDGLLHKKSFYNSNLGSIYDLENIQGALTPTPEACSKPLPSDLNESLTKSIRCPSLLEYDTEPSSQRSEDDYLPATLRAAISIANKSEDVASKDDTNDDNPAAPPTSNSNQKTINSKKKKSRTVRRSKSDRSEKQKDPNAPKLSKGITIKSLHARELETSNHEEKPTSALSLEWICRSEELRKPANRDSDKNRRRSENLHQRQSSYRREKGRQRKGNSSRDLAPPKPSSNRRPSKSIHSIAKGSSVSCKNLGTAQDDEILTKVSSVSCKNLVVDWSRQASPKEEQNERSQERLKKSSSNGSNAKRVRKTSKAGRNLPQVLAESEECNQNADWKRRSPAQANRKKPSKQKQVGKHSESQKSDDSSPTRNKKPKSRRSMMISSKATTDSCRDLLRKIHEINDDRLSNENRRPNTIKDESRTSSVDLLSRPMDSARQNKTKKNIGHSSSFRKTPKDSKEESNTSNKSNNSGKSRRKLQDEEKRQKPHRTKSAPLVLKGKVFNGKMSRSKSSDLLPTTDVDAVQTKPKKKSLSSRLLGMLSEGKGAGGSKDDETICTGNRNKDKKERKRLMRRCKSDSSLRESSQKKSGYDLMLSMHSIASHEKVEKDDTRENIHGDVESDDEDSFAASNPVKPKTQSSEPSIEKTEKMLSEYIKSRPVVSGHSNDVLPIAKSSSQKKLEANEGPISKPRRTSCLQIDFSQLSEHGTTGNIIVREKRMRSKIKKTKSNQNVRA